MRALVAAFFLIALFYIFFAIIFHPFNDNGIGQWFYNYQTLITGVLAIAAAVITVLEMRRSDEKQGERHQQLIEVATRGDQLKVQRAAFPQAGELKNFNRLLRSLESATFRHKQSGISEYVLGMREVTSQIKETLDRPQFLAGEDFFSGELTFRITQLRSKTKEALEYLAHPATFESYFSPEEKEVLFDKWYTRNEEFMRSHVEFCLEYNSAIADGVMEIAEMYKAFP